MNFHPMKRTSAFTLIEMLIVIVIIGILAAALIPRLTGLQARARDTARDADLRSIASAVEVYYIDNGSYPPAVYAPIALVPRQIALRDLLIPSVAAETRGSTLDTLDDGILSEYLKSVPRDPRGLGVAKADGSPSCVEIGDSYAYDSDGGSYYAITSRSEAGKGNAASCGNTIDRDGDGGYIKQGAGLAVNIQTASAGGTSTYPDPSLWTPENCFTFSAGTITAYKNSCPKDVIIPPEINGIAVTAIGSNPLYYNGVFYNKQLTSVTIPNSITTIGDNAFYYNPLTNISIPDSVTSIKIGAFTYNQLETITFGNSLQSIGTYAFYDNKLTDVILPNSLESIGDQAFQDNDIINLTLSNSLTSIGKSAFAKNKITRVTIPTSVSTMSKDKVFAFNGPNRDSGDFTYDVPETHGTRVLPAGSIGWTKE